MVASTGSRTPRWLRKHYRPSGGVPIVVDENRGEEPPLAGAAGRLREPTSEAVPHVGDLVRGRSTVVVNAPPDRVRATVLDFEHYAEFMPHYNASRLLRRTPGGGYEVYMQWAALHGALKMWARFEMRMTDSPNGIDTDGIEEWSSRFIEGNVRDARATWRFERLEGADWHVELTRRSLGPRDGRFDGESDAKAASKTLSTRPAATAAGLRREQRQLRWRLLRAAP